MAWYETNERLSSRDSQIHRFIKLNGSLVKNPKEEALYAGMSKDFEKSSKLQEEKCLLANTALYSITKHLKRLENDFETLEADGLLAPSEMGDQEDSMEVEESVRPRSSRASRSRHGVLSGRSLKRQRTEELTDDSFLGYNSRRGSPKPDFDLQSVTDQNKDEDELYCFCQNVSHGEMIGCDNSDCRFEWFHYACVGLTRPPQGTWYCPDCRAEPNDPTRKRKDKKRR